jgi:DNA invertase Pin-like site-specific DNA recombinase
LLWGYVRCSSTTQSLDLQIEDLNRHGVQHIRQEKISGSSMDNRPELKMLLDFVRRGDELYVCKIDRLARSMADLCRIIDILEEKGCALKVTQEPIETASPSGRMLVHILGAVAQFDNSLRRERQRAGIDAAKAKGRYKGRPPKITVQKVVAFYHENKDLSPTRMAGALDIDRTTFYRKLKEGGIKLSENKEGESHA